MLRYRISWQILQLLSISLSNTLVRPLLMHELILRHSATDPPPRAPCTQRIFWLGMSTDSKYYLKILDPSLMLDFCLRLCVEKCNTWSCISWCPFLRLNSVLLLIYRVISEPVLLLLIQLFNNLAPVRPNMSKLLRYLPVCFWLSFKYGFLMSQYLKCSEIFSRYLQNLSLVLNPIILLYLPSYEKTYLTYRKFCFLCVRYNAS